MINHIITTLSSVQFWSTSFIFKFIFIPLFLMDVYYKYLKNKFKIKG